MMLSDQQVRQYKYIGYTMFRGLLSPPEVAEILNEVESLSAGATRANHDASRMEMEPEQGPEGTLVRRLYEPCTYYPRFRALSESKDILDCIEQLVGPNVNFHYSKLNMKPPSIGSLVEWHQDLVYYPLTNRDSLAVLFYLDDADSHNGCLRVIPQRHLGPALDHTLNGMFQGRVTEAVDESKAVALEGCAGTAIFMHGMTPHCSAPNRSSKPRRTLILSYRAADAFPIHLGESTGEFESHVRLVRGERLRNARLSSGTFPIPTFPQKTKSLYELQEALAQQRSILSLTGRSPLMKNQPSIPGESRINGIRSIVVESDWLRVSILPEIRVKIYELISKAAGRNLLSQNPRVLPQPYPVETAMGDFWCRGWDDIFPTCKGCGSRGLRYPGLGEQRQVQFAVDDLRIEGEHGLSRLFAFTPISPVKAETTVRVWLAVGSRPVGLVKANDQTRGRGDAGMPPSAIIE